MDKKQSLLALPSLEANTAPPRSDPDHEKNIIEFSDESTTPKHTINMAGPYILGTKLGDGGMGVVYAGVHERTRHEVAIKLLRHTVTKGSLEHRRFVQEARILSRLDHPNIVKLYDYSITASGIPFLAMERVPGVDLARYLRRHRRLLWPFAVDILCQLGSALHVAHRAKVLHRDIKPNNILIYLEQQMTPDDYLPDIECSKGTRQRFVAKVADFGISKILDASPSPQTLRGQMMGTLEYLSPEATVGELQDHRSDIWSLGVVAYVLLTGQLPFSHPDYQQTLHRIRSQPLHLIRRTVPDVPQHVADAVSKALAKRPEDRYSSMADFVLALQGRAAVDLGRSTGAPVNLETGECNPHRTRASGERAQLDIAKGAAPPTFPAEEAGHSIPAIPMAFSNGAPAGAPRTQGPVTPQPDPPANQPTKKRWTQYLLGSFLTLLAVGVVGQTGGGSWRTKSSRSLSPAAPAADQDRPTSRPPQRGTNPESQPSELPNRPAVPGLAAIRTSRFPQTEWEAAAPAQSSRGVVAISRSPNTAPSSEAAGLRAEAMAEANMRGSPPRARGPGVPVTRPPLPLRTQSMPAAKTQLVGIGHKNGDPPEPAEAASSPTEPQAALTPPPAVTPSNQPSAGGGDPNLVAGAPRPPMNAIRFDNSLQRVSGADPRLPNVLIASYRGQTIEGTYLICVNPDGSVRSVKAVKGILNIDDYIINTLKQWRFPVQADATPVCKHESLKFQI